MSRTAEAFPKRKNKEGTQVHNAVFGDMEFSVGWKRRLDISLWDSCYNIVVKAKAYAESDGLTSEQEKSYTDFMNRCESLLQTVENLLSEYCKTEDVKAIVARMTPTSLLLERDGGCALLFNDTEDADNGVAVCLLSTPPQVMTQDEYL